MLFSYSLAVILPSSLREDLGWIPKFSFLFKLREQTDRTESRWTMARQSPGSDGDWIHFIRWRRERVLRSGTGRRLLCCKSRKERRVHLTTKVLPPTTDALLSFFFLSLIFKEEENVCGWVVLQDGG